MAGYRIPGPAGVTGNELIDKGTTCLSASRAPGPIDINQPTCNFDTLSPAEDGLEIVLTPVQLAAIFNNESIEQSDSLKERLWGGITVIGGALELAGATALLLTPEPTTATKVLGGSLGVHGIDTTTTGARQLVTGRTVTSLTADAVKSTSQAFGIDERNATLIGLTVDAGIPLIIGFAGAARVFAIRRGAISLAAEEIA